jgi:predicted enzyme involved in methoxymalonyl-ACP biosynthesis
VVLDSDCLDRALLADLKDALNRGVRIALICTCDPETASLMFERPGALLQRDDVAVLLANADDPVENLRAVSRALRIGLDSITFVSADPFARGFVSAALPGVNVPHASCGAFANGDAFLESLNMRMSVARFDEAHLPEIARFLQRSREFHLSPSNYTEEECQLVLRDPGVLPVYAKLSDRLRDYGVVAVVVLQPRDEEMAILDWAMSSGALWRGVEQQLMNHVVQEAQSRGCTRVSGEYVQNGKNALVSEFYAQFGFTMIGDEPGHTLWVLPVSAYDPVPTAIRES